MPDNYYSNIRREILPFLKKGPNRILELGCGYGETLKFLKAEDYASEVMGVELNPEAVKKSASLDKIIIADLEDFHPDFPKNYFDYIIMNDVLEHLRQPEVLIKKMTPTLKKTGFIITSIPTVRNWNVLFKLLLKGDFHYDEKGGILDASHLRFFTLKSMQELFGKCNLQIIDLKKNLDCHWIAKVFDILPVFSELGVVQYLFKLKPTDSG